MIDQNTKDYFDLVLNIKKYPYKDASLDFNHLMLLFGTVLSQKPKDICEIGIGTGLASLTILAALKYNEQPYNYTCVDNLYDLGGNLPQEIIDMLKSQNANIIISDEEKYVKECPDNSWDIVIGDADHNHSHEWKEHFFRITKNNGIIFLHDVINKGYPGLRQYLEYVQLNNIPHYLFDKSSLDTEGCHNSGFLMIINKK